MDKKCIKIFFEEIIQEASKGCVESYFKYNILFNTKISELGIDMKCNDTFNEYTVPTLKINNISLFNELLGIYVEKALDFYEFEELLEDDCNDYYKIKTILSLLWSNATVYDFENPIYFLKNRIQFFENKLINETCFEYSSFFESDLIVKTIKSKIVNETPYALEIKLSLNGLEYFFPLIYYGISDNKLYLYAMQSNKNNTNKFAKKVNRKLYKLNGDISFDDDIMNVTHSFVYAFNSIIRTAFAKSIKDIEVIHMMPIRYNAKLLSIYNKNKYYNDQSKYDCKLKLINADNIQYNITNKLINLCLRMAYHYENIDITNIPSGPEDKLQLKINDLEVNNDILNEVEIKVK